MDKKMADAENFEAVENIVDMPVLEEHHMVRNLRARYNDEKIYTNVGNILIAVNPYKLINIYGLGMVTKYYKTSASLPPHLFAQGNSAYVQMKEEMEDQVVVISGESGSGKTESTKLLMHFLAKISNKNGQSPVTEKILEANPILESFGNAKTQKNDNSSRFGKYVSLYFSNGAMVGSKTNKYLLERSRIVKQLDGERNYHIFYEMFKGLNDDMKQELRLTHIMDFAYLNFGKDAVNDSRDDLENFQIVERSFEHHHFTREETYGIFKTLSAILHLGNVTYRQTENVHRMDEAVLESEMCCRVVSDLLKVPFDGLKLVLTTRVTEARNEKMVTPLTKDQALDVRDSISKTLYYRIFRWLVVKINLNSKCADNLNKLNSISILDIFGFEDMKLNSFEQLCINYANESLQYYFNKHIFKIEQEEYKKEGVTWYNIDFLDNQPVMDLIAKRPRGIFHLLDEESYFPNGSDWSFLEKCHDENKKNALYLRPRMQNPEFSIKHYAGLVTYNVIGFLDKNRESLKSEVSHFLLESKCPLVSGFFENERREKRGVLRAEAKASTSPKTKCNTVSMLFHDSLQSLLEMMRCNPWFIRCIKPNDTKTPMLFQDDMVLNQLRATGMLETVKIRKLGFCIRQQFQVFYQKFKSLLPTTSTNLKVNAEGLRAVCKLILESQPETWINSWEIGKTKVFMKEDMMAHLVQAKSKMMMRAVLVFQKYARGRLARNQLAKKKKAILTLQAVHRGHAVRMKYNKTRDAVILIQAEIRRLFFMKRYKQMQENNKNRMLENNQKQIKKFQEESKARKSKILEEIMAEGPLPNDVIMEKISFKLNANTLEIPRELANQISRHPGTIDEDAFRQISNISPMSFKSQLPLDINTFDFKKYAEVYCPQGSLSYIPKGFYENPILPKASDGESKTSLELSKLLLRFLINDSDSAINQKLSVDYLIAKCLGCTSLRDEILLQICSKTFVEKKQRVDSRAWMLLTLCLGCFHSSQVLSNYILNYASSFCLESLAPYCQQNLLRSSGVGAEIDRCHPPADIEWMASHRRLPMALAASFYDGTEVCAEVDSWMCAEEFVDEMFRQRNIEDSGWSLELVDRNVKCLISGNDFVLDVVKEVETEHTFSGGNLYLLAYHIGPSQAKPEGRLAKMLPRRPVVMGDAEELREFVPAPARTAVPPNLFFKFADRKDSMYAKMDDHKALLSDLGIAERSPLNKRFMARYVVSDDQGQLQPVGVISESLLDLSEPKNKVFKRTFVDDNESPGLQIQNANVSLSSLVENVFESALKDDAGLSRVDAECISRRLKGGDEDKEKVLPAPVQKRKFQQNPNAMPRPVMVIPEKNADMYSKVQTTKRNNKQPEAQEGNKVKNIDFQKITEEDIEDDRVHFDLGQLQSSVAKLHARPADCHLTYTNARWKLRARKEIFTRIESTTNDLLNDLIYRQIISDLDDKCIKIGENEENELKERMGCRDLDFVTKRNHSAAEKSTIIEVAKKWPNYFSRIYQVSGGTRLTSIQCLGVGHSGVRLLSRVKRGQREQFNVIENISYEEIIDVCVPQPHCLQIHYKTDKFIALYFRQAAKARHLIEAFCIELEQNSVYVRAVQNYATSENLLLNFAKGDIIKLTHKNQVLEKGWLFGAVHGKAGMFPAEYVVSVAIHQVPLKTFEVYNTLPDFSTYSTSNEPSYSSFEDAKEQFIMLDYAARHFRKCNSISSFLRKDENKAHKAWEGQEYLELIKWTKSPIKDSLTMISSDNLNKIAVSIFKCIMEYMHDYPLTKGCSSHTSVSTIFARCRDYEELIDETYCQIIKQLTSNRSPKGGSSQLGWRLLLMFTSFFECGWGLRPYVVKYMEETARDKYSENQKLAEKCVHNLKQTLKYGGRKGILDKSEISSITLGRYVRQIVCTYPGNASTRIFAETSMVVKDAVEQICDGFAIGRAESREYIIYVIQENDTYIPLDGATYVMDVITDLVLKEKPCELLFSRFTWVYPLQAAISLSHLSLLFEQSKPEYLDGFIVQPPPKGAPGNTREIILRLTFFLMKHENFTAFQDKKSVQKYLPKNVVKLFNAKELQLKLEQLQAEYGNIPPQQAQSYFLEILSTFPLFGSTAFVINQVTGKQVNGKCLLGINRSGLNFMSEKSMELLWTLPLHQILSVNIRLGGRRYLELKHGDLMHRVMTHIFLDNPHPLKLLIEKYISVQSIFRSSSSSTGSSTGLATDGERPASK